MPPQKESPESMFARLAKPHESGCVLWTGKLDRDGYGLISIVSHRWKFAHRYAWFRKYGEWPDGAILHSCDVRNCVNVDHLSVGTNADIVRDAILKGRLDNRGERHGMHKLTDESVKDIRDAYLNEGVTQVKLAKRFGVTQSIISMICSRKIWKHVGND